MYLSCVAFVRADFGAELEFALAINDKFKNANIEVLFSNLRAKMDKYKKIEIIEMRQG